MPDDPMAEVEVEMADPEDVATTLPPVDMGEVVEAAVVAASTVGAMVALFQSPEFMKSLKLATEIAGDPSCVTMPSHRATLVDVLERVRDALA